jgi:hypothetical protein
VLGLAGWRERGAGPGVAARMPVAVGCLHLAYGAGFWSGLGQQALSSRAIRSRAGAPALPPSAADGLADAVPEHAEAHTTPPSLD